MDNLQKNFINIIAKILIRFVFNKTYKLQTRIEDLILANAAAMSF